MATGSKSTPCSRCFRGNFRVTLLRHNGPVPRSPCPRPACPTRISCMSRFLLCVLFVALAIGISASELQAQLAVELSYGADRNVESEPAETDGWLNGTVEWMFPSGLGIGIGSDHHFEGASIDPSDHLGWALYFSASQEFPLGGAAPFIRGGIGLGRAPCQGDTCSDGLYLRGSGGVRIRLSHALRATGEIGLSRVSRPFGGAGLSLRF